MAACRKVCLAHLFAHMHLLFFDLCDWWTCYGCFYVRGIVGWLGMGVGRDLHIDQVSLLDYFVYKAGNAPMIFLFHCEKATHNTTNPRISFFE